jgi:hypothetical protein
LFSERSINAQLRDRSDDAAVASVSSAVWKRGRRKARGRSSLAGALKGVSHSRRRPIDPCCDCLAGLGIGWIRYFYGDLWHDIRIISLILRWRNISSGFPALVSRMGEVVQFIKKPAPERTARLIQEARAIYESIFPTQTARAAPVAEDNTSS